MELRTLNACWSRRVVFVLLLLFFCVPRSHCEEDFDFHLQALRTNMSEGLKAGKRPKAQIQMSGAVDVKVVGETNDGPVIELAGNPLNMSWAKISHEEQLSILRGFVGAEDAQHFLSLVVVCHHWDLRALEEQFREKTITLDPGLKSRFPASSPENAPVQTAAAAPKTPAAAARPETGAVGPRGFVGAGANAKTVKTLHITKSGVYENMIVDGEFDSGVLVRISADNVVLRNCEIRNNKRNGVEVYGKKVSIENCKIHHLLSGTYKKQDDAHGITGTPADLIIRDCEISYCSGDSIQFDPARDPWDNVVVEHCSLWTGPLPSDAAGFKKGERPGENAIDTKQRADHPRSRLALRNCIARGFRDGQIGDMAAFNIKDNVEVTIEDCVLTDNEICMRLRGPGKYGGSKVSVRNCAMYDSKVGVRMEDGIAGLKISGLAFGAGIGKKYMSVSGGAGAGFEQGPEQPAPPFEIALKNWGQR